MHRRRFVSHQTWKQRLVKPWQQYDDLSTLQAFNICHAGRHLCNVSELLAGEVDEGQVVEAGGDGGVVLDEGVSVGVFWEELVNPSVVAQQAAVSSE